MPGCTESGDYFVRREEARLNDWSDEWFRLSDEFPTKEELIEFTLYLNERVRLPLENRVPEPVAV